MTKTVAPLPMPDKLEPKMKRRSLMTSVRNYFYSLYNATNSQFKVMLGSTNNEDAVTGNRMFDRGEAVGMIKKEAERANDKLVVSAKSGDIYHCIVNLMKENGITLKLRRAEHKRLTRTVAAE